MKLKNTLILALILAIIPASRAIAHKVIIFAWVEDGMIHTESSFGSKRKAKDCTITVVDEKDMVVYTGKTDQDGNHVFKIPENIDSDLILNLDAGTGHKGQWRLSKDELVAVPSPVDIRTAMDEKEKLEKNPSAFKIIGGIGIIFLLALGIRLLKRKAS
ncbi:hypothetical protein [Desulfobacula phenolica]|uniref:Nickel transport protein n=1 Tax=Desulfobacula phenolica TaxID=90732 RepID=A0A1H2DPM3_9BACT|nr:hypothetical protein [Desulfobacula phenolica]SDT84840.1 nickel transport protein [Desulfobacula phenolica]